MLLLLRSDILLDQHCICLIHLISKKFDMFQSHILKCGWFFTRLKRHATTSLRWSARWCPHRSKSPHWKIQWAQARSDGLGETNPTSAYIQINSQLIPNNYRFLLEWLWKIHQEVTDWAQPFESLMGVKFGSLTIVVKGWLYIWENDIKQQVGKYKKYLPVSLEKSTWNVVEMYFYGCRYFSCIYLKVEKDMNMHNCE